LQSVGRDTSPRAAYALLQLTVLVWGFTAILGKQISINAFAMVWYRQVITAVVLIAWALWNGRSMRVDKKSARNLLAVSLLVSVHWVCFYACIKFAGVAVAVLCLASVVVVTALVEPLIYRRPVKNLEVLMGLGVLVGVWLLVRVSAQASWSALLLGLAAAVCGATFGTLNGKLRQGLSSEVMSIWELGGGAAWLSLAFIVVPENMVFPWEISADDWLWLSILSVVCTALPWMWSLDVVAVLTPYTVALSVTLEPVYSMIIAYFWFPESERLAPSFYVGAGLLIALVMLNARLKR